MKVAVLCQSSIGTTRMRRLVRRDPDCIFLCSGPLLDSTLDAGIDVAGQTFRTTWMRASDGSGTRTEKVVKGFTTILAVGDDDFVLRVQRLLDKCAVVGIAPSATDDAILSLFQDLEKESVTTATVVDDSAVALDRLRRHSLGRIVSAHVGGFKNVSSSLVTFLSSLVVAPATRWFLEGSIDEKPIGHKEYGTAAEAQAVLQRLKTGPLRIVSTDENVEIAAPRLARFGDLIDDCGGRFSALYVDRLLRGLIDQGLVGCVNGVLSDGVSATVRAFIADTTGSIQLVPFEVVTDETSYYAHDVGVKPSQCDVQGDRRLLYQAVWNRTVAAHAGPSTFVKAHTAYAELNSRAPVLELTRIVQHKPADKPDWFTVSGGAIQVVEDRIYGDRLPTWKVREVQIAEPRWTREQVGLLGQAEADGLVLFENGRSVLTDRGRVLELLGRTCGGFLKASGSISDVVDVWADDVSAATKAEAVPSLHVKCACGKQLPRFEGSVTKPISSRCRSCKKNRVLSVKDQTFTVEQS